jgi:broad specificity phosphatase PhoE
MKVIYFVRHGESDANVEGIISGAEHDALLTNKGKAQATAAGRDLADKRIQLIVCSPMRRTVATATYIAKTIGYDPKDIVSSDHFIERAFGELSGKPATDYAEAFKQNKMPDSVESSKALHDRVTQGMAWLASRKEERIVVVSHGGTGRMVKVITQALQHGQLYEVERLDNAEIYRFTL